MQITVLVAIVAALTAGTLVADGEAPAAWWGMFLSVRQTIAGVAGVMLLTLAFFRIDSVRLHTRLDRAGPSHRRCWRLPTRMGMLEQVILLGVFIAILCPLGWARLVGIHWQLGRFFLVDEIMLLLPFLVLQTGRWYLSYPVNRLMREWIVSAQLAEGLSARPVWSRRQFLSFQIRHHLLIFLAPIIIILAIQDAVEFAWPYVLERGWITLTEDQAYFAGEGFVMIGALGVFVLAPLLLRRIWRTRPLPSGPLREKLQLFGASLKLRYRELLLWDTHSAVANAAVMGLLGKVRYVLLSDALIENMPDEQIEAVFGHEAGHVAHHHIGFLTMFVLSSLLLISLGFEWLRAGLGRFGEAHHWPQETTWAVVTAMMLGIGLCWLHVFGWVSRRFERQADVHAARAIGQDFQNRYVANSNGACETDNRLSPRGAAVMGSALRRIALLNGISPEARSFRHSSIHGRSLFLMHLAQDTRGYRKFCKSIIAIKIAIVLALLAGFLLWWLVGGPTTPVEIIPGGVWV
ncbi:MAG: M48 family metalloprotease [Sedimentisphaerales bacterium]|nr:M48 family metalloprotease [Sedimentisphaerales bacterium]